jgi:hypothetical protein
MKVVRIVAIALGTVVVLYFLAINFLPEWAIVGVHFSRPWWQVLLVLIALVVAFVWLIMRFSGRKQVRN